METEQKKKAPPKILIVDDLSVNVEILQAIIEAEGYEPLCALSVQEALEIMNQQLPQLILSDITMPETDGLEFCRMMKQNPRTREIPFIFITVANTSEEKKAAFSAGAVDFIPKPFERFEVVMRVNNHLSSYRYQQELKDYNRLMNKMMSDQKKQMEKEREHVLLALAKILEKRNVNMGHHLEQVGYNCRKLAQSLQLVPPFEHVITDAFVETIASASKLHDIGNLLLPDDMLDQNGNLKQERADMIRRHTEDGASILEEMQDDNNSSRFLLMAVEIARYHHARWDGTGYPENVKGKDIPLSARITSLVNDLDAMLSGYYYEKPYSLEESLSLIESRSGSYYDPDIVRIFLKVVKQFQTD